MRDIELPIKKDETTVFWEGDAEDSEPARGVLVSDGDGRWSIVFQRGWEDDDGILSWNDFGDFTPDNLREFNLTLAKAFNEAANSVHAEMLDIRTKGKSELPIGPNHVTLIRGGNKFNVRLTREGDGYDGHPIIGLTLKRPITAEEGFVLCKRLAIASDWYTARMGDL